MHPTKLKLTNFLSFKELEYDFVNGPVLLVGENRTDDGQESNGSGKTAIQSALEKCWLDYVSRERVRDVDLIRRGTDEAVIESWIHCPVRCETLHIKRTLTRKGNRLELSVNDSPISFATVNDGNDWIINWIGISKEDLSNYYIVNKRRFVSFFSSSNTQKLQLLARFSNTDFLDSVDADIKERVSVCERELSSIQNEKATLDGRVDLLRKQVEETTEERFREGQERRIEVLEEEVGQLTAHNLLLAGSVTELDRKMADIKASISVKGKELERVKESLDDLSGRSEEAQQAVCLVESELGIMKEEEGEINRSYRETKDSESEILNALAGIRNRLAGLITCPKCGHRFLLGEDIDVDAERAREAEIKELHTMTQIALKELNDALDQHKRKIEEKRMSVSAERDKADEISREISRIKKELIGIENNIVEQNEEFKHKETRRKRTLEEIQSTEAEIAVKKSNIEKIKEEKFEDNSYHAGIIKQLEEEEVKQLEVIKRLDEKGDELRVTREWLVQFKEFRMYLANIGIKEIQGRCNETLRDMGSDLMVSIDGFKRKADGTLKDEITPTIIRDGALPFGLFSGGERGRLEYAMMLSLQGMINRSNPHGGMSFLFTDEVAEGIDAMGLTLLVKALSRFEFPILITTHVVNQSVGTRVLKVIKENNVSRIEI